MNEKVIVFGYMENSREGSCKTVCKVVWHCNSQYNLAQLFDIAVKLLIDSRI